MAACGSTTASARAPSQGWLRAMKPMTLTSVPIWTTGVEMAAAGERAHHLGLGREHGHQGTTPIRRLRVAGGVGHLVLVEPLADQAHDALAHDREPQAQQELDAGAEQHGDEKARAQPAQPPDVAALDEAVDRQLLELERHGGQCRHQQRQADEQKLLPTGDPPYRTIELAHAARAPVSGAGRRPWRPGRARRVRRRRRLREQAMPSAIGRGTALGRTPRLSASAFLAAAMVAATPVWRMAPAWIACSSTTAWRRPAALRCTTASSWS